MEDYLVSTRLCVHYDICTCTNYGIVVRLLIYFNSAHSVVSPPTFAFPTDSSSSSFISTGHASLKYCASTVTSFFFYSLLFSPSIPVCGCGLSLPCSSMTFEAKVKSVLSGDTVVLSNLSDPTKERTLSLAYVSAPRLRREGDEVSLGGAQLQHYCPVLLLKPVHSDHDQLTNPHTCVCAGIWISLPGIPP